MRSKARLLTRLAQNPQVSLQLLVALTKMDLIVVQMPMEILALPILKMEAIYVK